MQFKRSSKMAAFTLPCCHTFITLLVFFSRTLAADPNSFFSYRGFDINSNFESNLSLYGDAKVSDDGSSVQLTDAVSSSTGRVMYNKPIKLVEGKPWKLVSFSTFLEFSLSSDNGGGLAFVMVPRSFKGKVFGNSSFGLSPGLDKSKVEVIAVEFDTSVDVNYKDLNENHAGIDMGSLISVKAKNLSSVNMVFNSGQKLHAWIDYEASSKRLEVRLSNSGSLPPADPLIYCPIDFSKLWQDEDVFVGFSSSNGNSSQTWHIYSWTFKLRHVPRWMHSEPADPKAFVMDGKTLEVHKRNHCLWRMTGALIFGTGCGALGALIVLYLWNVFGNRQPVAPEEFAVQPLEFEHKKFNVAVEKAIEDGK